ncbi:MAG: hypothetical protein ACEPOV_03580 [Hyphomicrobiales bacterium]
MRKTYYILFLLSIAVIYSNSLFSQNLNAIANTDTTQLPIGAPVNLQLKVSAPKEGKVLWPALNDTIGNQIVVLSSEKRDTATTNNKDIQTIIQNLKITSFDTGNVVIPSIAFKYVAPDSMFSEESQTAPIELYINSPKVDTTKVFKPIVGPIHQSLTFWMMAPYIGGGLLLAIIVVIAIIIIIRRKNAKPIFTPKPKPVIPPHELAVQKLEVLKGKTLWQNSKFKEYYTELTDIAREYLNNRFNIFALEMTTDEIMSSLPKSEINEQAREKLYNTLVLADLVKFAKEKPTAIENDGCLMNIYDFVKETKLKEQILEDEKGIEKNNNKDIKEL